MISKIIQILVTLLIVFGMSLMIIPMIGIIFGLIKKLI